MIEPLFRSGSPLWAPMSSPLGEWVQSLAGIPNSAQSFGLPIPMLSDPYGYGLPLNAVALNGIPFTVPALLATVAIKRGQLSGPTNDQENEEFLYDALELLPGTNEVEVRSEGGRVTLTGSVPSKRLKRELGEIAWTIPAVNDVQNNVNIATRRRARSTSRDVEQHPSATSRKQA